MFNWGYALIGLGVGWLSGKASAASRIYGAQNQGYQSILGLAILGFLIFSASFGVEWFLVGLAEVFIGSFVAIKMSAGNRLQ